MLKLEITKKPIKNNKERTEYHIKGQAYNGVYVNIKIAKKQIKDYILETLEERIKKLEEKIKVAENKLELIKEMKKRIDKAIWEKFKVAPLDLCDASSLDFKGYEEKIENDKLILNNIKSLIWKNINDFEKFALAIDQANIIIDSYGYEASFMYPSEKLLINVKNKYHLNCNFSDLDVYDSLDLDIIKYKDKEGDSWKGISIGEEVALKRNGQVKKIKTKDFINYDYTNDLVEIYGKKILK